MLAKLEAACRAKGLKMTEQRRIVGRVLAESRDHPDAEEVHRRAARLDPGISLATVYRTIRVLEEAQVIERLDFRDGRARYEESDVRHHYHMIDTATGAITEFESPELEGLIARTAERLGVELVRHRLELYGRKKERKPPRRSR